MEKSEPWLESETWSSCFCGKTGEWKREDKKNSPTLWKQRATKTTELEGKLGSRNWGELSYYDSSSSFMPSSPDCNLKALGQAEKPGTLENCCKSENKWGGWSHNVSSAPKLCSMQKKKKTIIVKRKKRKHLKIKLLMQQKILRCKAHLLKNSNIQVDLKIYIYIHSPISNSFM